MHDQRETAPTTLVYGTGMTGELVLLPRARAEALAELYAALNGATTWGELRERLPAATYAEIVPRLDRYEARRPLTLVADALFEAGMIPGFEDGDWPDFPAQAMLTRLPADLQGRYGTVAETTRNGPYLALAPGITEVLVAALTARG